jgi:hypothetical protein
MSLTSSVGTTIEPDSLVSPLPREFQEWPTRDERLVVSSDVDLEQSSFAAVKRYAADKAWVWPPQTLYFVCDIHADTEAFLLSLAASGGVELRGADEFVLTEEGKNALFVIGGDCLDKGPANLRLLRAVKRLYDAGAHVKLLAGNHDLRTYLGIACSGRREVALQHLFVRMGKKTLRLLQEVYEQYVKPKTKGKKRLLSDDEVHERLFPTAEWYDEFRSAARGLIPEKKLTKELSRIREKIADLEHESRAYGLSLGAMHAAVEECRRLFLEPTGEFAWFFERMEIAYRAGSFLFIHAGVDDYVAALLKHSGVGGLNDEFKRLLTEDLFELYHGSIGNCFRTKYRDIDYPLSGAGLRDLHGAGIYAIVHGHRNIHHGQRMVFRSGLLNFECDASVDRNTRILEKLSGPGGAVTVFKPDGRLLGISTDYPFVKVFEPSRISGLTSLF